MHLERAVCGVHCQYRDSLFAEIWNRTRAPAIPVRASQKSPWCQVAAMRRNVISYRRLLLSDFDPPTSGENDDKIEIFLARANLPGARTVFR
jgi:hypothetical protein